MATAMHPHVHQHMRAQQPPDGYKQWICVYPIYINKEKTLSEGRRIKKNNAVKEPIFPELLEVMRTTGLQSLCLSYFPIVGEPNKIHPREVSRGLPKCGRIRVQIKNDEGEIINEKFKTREDVYLHLAKMIPQLKSRTAPKHNPEEGKKKGKGKKK